MFVSNFSIKLSFCCNIFEYVGEYFFGGFGCFVFDGSGKICGMFCCVKVYGIFFCFGM